MDAAQSLSELFPSTAPQTNATTAPSELGQEDFLELMVAQLENQDPTKPMDNFEFLSQIAQFGTVEGIQGIQQGFEELSSVLYANQTLQAAGLVGDKVVTDSNFGVLGAAGEPLDASMEVPSANQGVTLYIQDSAGRLVHSREMGVLPPGEVKVQWDGIADDGLQALPGQYRISAEATVAGQTQGISVYAHTLVESVTVDRGAGGVTLNLAGGDQVGLNQVRSFL